MSEVKRVEVLLHGPLRTAYMVEATHFDRVTAERDALQALLTAADERADTATSLIQRIVANFDTEIEFHEDVAPNDLEHDQVLAEMRVFLAALKPAEGVGDDTTLEEDREDFKKVFVRINTKQGQSISLADMIARYEKKP